ncbi:MAG: 3-phosphoshikimate 1-carboxyvinyltransferase [Selenomonadaceae bacterium]|nr:3-phosphoshikimate 1-carboxyvinyltransferase [Selenomonadaceae bacterium]
MIKIKPADKPLRGTIKVPPDKSISHRAIIFSALFNSAVEVFNCLDAADVRSTIGCMQALGADIQRDGDSLLVKGNALRQSATPLDAGNSGTTARLLTGLLAAQPFQSTIIGDASLSKRPMARVINPLKKMGADISARDDNFLPINIKPAKLHGIDYCLPVPSAQLKSALLFAALFADGKTTIAEPIPARDHTELMLAAFNANITRAGNSITLDPSAKLSAPDKIFVPADFSSAAFFIVLAAIIPDSLLTIEDVGVNPTRTGLLDVLRAMGANITLSNLRTQAGEPRADLTVAYAPLHAAELTADIIPRLIDEIPILAVAAAFAEGTSRFRDLAELRVKESDRLAAIVEQFNRIAPGAFRAEGDTLFIQGQCPTRFADCHSLGDHRIAMALTVFATAAHGAAIENQACVDISFPNFFDYFC